MMRRHPLLLLALSLLSVSLSAGLLLIGGRRIAENQLRSLARQAGFSVAWRTRRWSGLSLCLNQAVWRSPKSHGQGREICLEAGLQMSWPPLTLSRLSIKSMKLKLKGDHCEQLRHRLSHALSSSSERGLVASSSKLRGLSQRLSQSQIQLAGVELSGRCLNTPLTLSVSGQIDGGEGGGEGEIRGGAMPFAFSWRRIHEQLSLRPKGKREWALTAAAARASLEGVWFNRRGLQLRGLTFTLERPPMRENISLQLGLKLSISPPQLHLSGGKIEIRESRPLSTRKLLTGERRRPERSRQEKTDQSTVFPSYHQLLMRIGKKLNAVTGEQLSISYNGRWLGRIQTFEWRPREGGSLELSAPITTTESGVKLGRLSLSLSAHEGRWDLIAEADQLPSTTLPYPLPVTGRLSGTLYGVRLPLPYPSHLIPPSHEEVEPLFVGALKLSHGLISPPLSDSPLGPLDGEIQFNMSGRRAAGELEIESLGREQLALRGQLRWDQEELDGTLAFHPTSCQEAYHSLPAALLGPLANAKLEGEWAPSLRFSLPLDTPTELNLKTRGLMRRCRYLTLNHQQNSSPDIKVRGARADLSDVKWLLSPFVMRVREGVSERARVFVGPGTKNYIPLSELPPYVAGAMYLTEEMGFWQGGAISPALIRKALGINLDAKRVVYGGSTITQQLVKNLFLSREKTLIRKLREAIIAGRIIDRIPKQRVIELYLNCIEFGPDIYGISRAARYYFQKNARSLSPTEAVFLAMLKTSPWRGPRIRRRGRTPQYPWWAQRNEEIFRRLLERGLISPQAARRAPPYQLRWNEGTYIP